jgi:hypothetical protein
MTVITASGEEMDGVKGFAGTRFFFGASGLKSVLTPQHCSFPKLPFHIAQNNNNEHTTSFGSPSWRLHAQWR